MAPDPNLPQPGAIVAGKYRVERVLGVGGMGTVFAVRHLGLDEARALKLMLPKGLELPQARERFFREARAAAKLRSDHAVKIHDVAVSPEGFPYIEMELLEGSDLATIVRRSGAVPIDRAVRWIAEACEPVGEAHALGIVHRDLKPGNLFLTRRRDGGDAVKVLDFGIAKTRQQLETDPTLTSTNASFGSPMYMSPEQMRGARFAEPRSDLWALGVVLYELVTGRRPFQAESATALALVVTGEEPAPPRSLRADLPAAVEAVILRCLAKRPEARYASAEELAAALRASIPGAADARPPMPSVPQAFVAAPPSPFPFGAPTGQPPAPQPAVAPSPSAGTQPSSAPSFAIAPPSFGPSSVAAVHGFSHPPATPQPTAPEDPRPGPAASPWPPTSGGVPSQPTVATLTTTVGRRGGNGGALVIGGALAASAVAAALLFVLLRSPSDDDAPAAASASGTDPVAASPEGGAASDPPPGSDARAAPADEAPAPEPPAPEAAATDDPAAPAAPASAREAPRPEESPARGEGTARPPSSSPRPPASAAASVTAPRPPQPPAAAPPRSSPKTGFGGID